MNFVGQAVRIVITHTWRVTNIPGAYLAQGQVFDVPERLALYLIVLGCARALHNVAEA